MTHRALNVAWAGIAVVLASCSGSEGPPDPTLSSIELSPPSATIQAGATQQFTATGHFSDGGMGSVAVTWTATGGTVSAGGLYTAGSVAGTYQVVATEQGGSIAKAAAVAVTAAPPVLTSISVAPATISLAPAATQQFTATGHYSGGGTGSVAVNWSATGGTISLTGFFTAGSVVGSYQVTATQTGGSILGTAAVTITPAPPTLTSITVDPPMITLIPAATQQFTATAHYSDNSTGTIPVDWAATGGTVSGDGLYTAGATDGSYQVTATATGGSISGSASVTIATPPPNLVAIEVSPPGVRILPYITQQYTAVGRLSDNSTVPVAVTWNVTFSSLSTVHNTITPGGLFQAGTVLDTFMVTATEVGGSSLSGSVPVSVHSTSGLTVSPVPFAFWNPEPGKVYVCTSNHYTDDPAGLGGVAATVAAPAGGVTAPSVSYTNLGPHMYANGSGEVQVVCQVVWSAPPPPNDVATVTITVSENPGSGMAKVFNYTRLQCFSPPVPPSPDPTPRPCNRTDFTDQQNFDPARTTPVSATVTVSATTGANIWFKNTRVP